MVVNVLNLLLLVLFGCLFDSHLRQTSAHCVPWRLPVTCVCVFFVYCIEGDCSGESPRSTRTKENENNSSPYTTRASFTSVFFSWVLCVKFEVVSRSLRMQDENPTSFFPQWMPGLLSCIQCDAARSFVHEQWVSCCEWTEGHQGKAERASSAPKSGKPCLCDLLLRGGTEQENNNKQEAA